MTKEKTLRIAQIQKTWPGGMSDTPGAKPEALRRLFKKMESGVQPDFLEIMGAISNMVAFYTDHDTSTGEEQIEEFLMSQNKCRFCS